MIQVRQAVLEDVPQIQRLAYKYIGEYDFYTDEELRKWIDYTVVAVLGCRVVGICIGCSYADEEQGQYAFELRGIAVDVLYRGRDVAARMVKRLVCKLENGKGFCLARGTVSKAPVGRALQSVGFELERTIPDYWQMVRRCKECCDSGDCACHCVCHLYTIEKVG